MQIWRICVIKFYLIIVLQNMDDVYDTFGSTLEKSNPSTNSLELETNAILRQALDPTLKSKYYINRNHSDPIDKAVCSIYVIN